MITAFFGALAGAIAGCGLALAGILAFRWADAKYVAR